jgi:hypothetical protein
MLIITAFGLFSEILSSFQEFHEIFEISHQYLAG